MLRLATIILAVTIAMPSSGQEDGVHGYMGTNKLTYWVPRVEFGYGITGSTRSGDIPEAHEIRIGNRASIALMHHRYQEEPYWGISLTYTDRGTRKDVYPNNPLLVGPKEVNHNRYIGVSGRFGGDFAKLWFVEFDIGLDYLFQSEQFDPDVDAHKDVPRVSVVSQLILGRNFPVTRRLIIHTDLNCSMLVGRPWFCFTGISVGLKRKSFAQICGVPSEF